MQKAVDIVDFLQKDILNFKKSRVEGGTREDLQINEPL